MTPEEARKAVDYLLESAPHYAAAKAMQEKCESMMKRTKALAMKASGENSAAAQEREAYASEEYLQAIDERFEATVKAETLKGHRDAARMRIEFWRSFNSNLKAAERGFGSGS